MVVSFILILVTCFLCIANEDNFNLASLAENNNIRILINQKNLQTIGGNLLAFHLISKILKMESNPAIDITIFELTNNSQILSELKKTVLHEEHIVFLLCGHDQEMSCDNCFQQISDIFTKSKRRTVKFFIVTHQSVTDSLLMNCGPKFSLGLDSDVYILTHYSPNKTNTEFINVYEVYTLAEHGLIVNFLGNSNNITELTYQWNRKWVRRMDLKGILITAIATNEPQTEYEILNGKVSLKGGIGSDIFCFFRMSMNFSDRILVEDIWPKQDANGKWLGMGKLLTEGDADIAIVFTTVLTTRARSFNFLVPHLKNALIAVFLQPSWSSVRNVYLSPFKLNLWMSLVGLLIAIFISLRILVCAIITINFKWHKGLRGESLAVNITNSLTDPLMWLLSGVSKQGWNPMSSDDGDKNEGLTLSKTPIKIIICIVIPCSILVLFNYFGASLYKFLSAEIVPIKTLGELLRSDLYLVADNSSQTVTGLILYPENVSWEDAETSQILKAKKIYTKHSKDAKSDIVSSPGALITYPSTLNSENSGDWKDTSNGEDGKDLCEYGRRLSVIPISMPYPAAMMTPKGSVYKKLFNIQIIVIIESGIMKRLLVEFQNKMKPRCLNPQDLLFGANNGKLFSFISLTMTDLFTAFVILFCGFGACIFLLLLELLWDYRVLKKIT